MMKKTLHRKKRCYRGLRLLTCPILIYLFLCNTLVFGCTPKDGNYSIKGDGFTSISDQTIYLIDAYKHDVIDSTQIKNGAFLFEMNNTTINQKQLSIVFSYNGRKDLIGFPTSKGYYTSFFLEKATTKIIPHQRKDGFKNSISAEIIDGVENKILYEYPSLMIPIDADKQTYDAIFQKLVNKYPQSEYMATCLYSLRNYFDISDYKNIYDLLSPHVKNNQNGQMIWSFIKSIQDHTDFIVLDSSGQKQHDVHRKKAVNMLVFWATWCGPCIQEIPQLKQIYEKYKSADFSVSSISIDDSPDKWLKFLKRRNDMVWPQFILPTDKKEVISYTYTITAVPLIIFTDQKGEVLQRYEDGYATDNIEKFSRFIDSYLEK